MQAKPCQHDCIFDGKRERLNGVEIATKYWDRLSARDKEHFKDYVPTQTQCFQDNEVKERSVEIDDECLESWPCVHHCVVNGTHFTLDAKTIVTMYWDKLNAMQRKHFYGYKMLK